MGLEQRHLAAPELRAVLDVVVHEEGVVEELERGRRQQRLLRAPAHRARLGQHSAHERVVMGHGGSE
jgi:hypothetical protein